MDVIAKARRESAYIPVRGEGLSLMRASVGWTSPAAPGERLPRSTTERDGTETLREGEDS